MKQTDNLGLALYDSSDRFQITGESKSFNHNMELIDAAIKELENGSGGGSGTGTNGLSAYEIAVQHGFTGTKEEWLASLHGTTPVKGTDYFTEEEINELITQPISEIREDVNGKLASNQGTENNGKFLCINADGNVIPTEIHNGGSGDIDLSAYRTANEQDKIDEEQNRKINRSVYYDPDDEVDESLWLSELLAGEIKKLSLDCDEEGNLSLYYGENLIDSVMIVGAGSGSSVEVIPCESVSLNTTEKKLKDIDVGYKLTAAIEPVTSTQKVRWSTSDGNIATVSNDGTVTLTGNTGSVTIYAVCGSQSASCTITVVSRVTKTVYEFWIKMNAAGVCGGYEYYYVNKEGILTQASSCYSAPKLPVEAGDVISGTFKSRGIPVCYYDIDGNIMWDIIKNIPETNDGNAIEYVINETVPEGVAFVKVSSMNSGNNIGTPYFKAYDIY